VTIVTVALNAALAKALVGYLVAPFLVGAAIVAWGMYRLPQAHQAIDLPRNPLQLWSAIQMTAIFQLVLLTVALVHRVWGEPGVIASGAVLGLTDLDALTISMARAPTPIPMEVAARAIVVGILANTALKLAVAIVVGVAGFRRLTGPALVAIGVAVGGSLLFLR
jgi:uncharacterized membrane protein (DUF4010 family)